MHCNNCDTKLKRSPIGRRRLFCLLCNAPKPGKQRPSGPVKENVRRLAENIRFY